MRKLKSWFKRKFYKKLTKGDIQGYRNILKLVYHKKAEHPTLDINRTTYSNVISDINNEIVDLIIEKNLNYVLPYLGSSLSIKKVKRIPKIKNNKLFNTAPIDWKTTNELWNSDEEAKEKKLLIRYTNSHTMKYVFRIYFKKYISSFINKQYYSFKPCRTFQRLLGKRINDDTKNRYDSYLLY